MDGAGRLPNAQPRGRVSNYCCIYLPAVAAFGTESNPTKEASNFRDSIMPNISINIFDRAVLFAQGVAGIAGLFTSFGAQATLAVVVGNCYLGVRFLSEAVRYFRVRNLGSDFNFVILLGLTLVGLIMTFGSIVVGWMLLKLPG